MIHSTLTPFVEKRLQALESVDQVAFPMDLLHVDSENKRPSLQDALIKGAPSILFEIKKASPSMGELSQANALDMCNGYVSQGAKAISVLVDRANFNGHPKDLKDCCDAHPHLPFLHKDFVATAYQVRLAKHLGASSVLLMCQLLEPAELRDLYQLATSLGLEPFVEVHNSTELEFALELNPPIIGINSRDFKTTGMPVDLNTAPQLLKQLQEAWPKGTALVAQSGIFSANDIKTLCDSCPSGLPNAIQIGSSLSQAGEIPPWLRKML